MDAAVRYSQISAWSLSDAYNAVVSSSLPWYECELCCVDTVAGAVAVDPAQRLFGALESPRGHQCACALMDGFGRCGVLCRLRVPCWMIGASAKHQWMTKRCTL